MTRAQRIKAAIKVVAVQRCLDRGESPFYKDASGVRCWQYEAKHISKLLSGLRPVLKAIKQ